MRTAHGFPESGHYERKVCLGCVVEGKIAVRVWGVFFTGGKNRYQLLIRTFPPEKMPISS